VPGVAAICVTGKPFIFAVGADLTGVPRLTDRGQALAIGKLGHQVLGMLGELHGPHVRLRQRRRDGWRR
jgi:hypothetical protein